MFGRLIRLIVRSYAPSPVQWLFRRFPVWSWTFTTSVALIVDLERRYFGRAEAIDLGGIKPGEEVGFEVHFPPVSYQEQLKQPKKAGRKARRAAKRERRAAKRG